MTSIRLKYRASAVAGKPGCLYFQIIHERKVRQLAVPGKVFADEWNQCCGMVTCARDSSRFSEIMALRDELNSDIRRLARIVKKLENKGIRFTADEIVLEYEQYCREYSLGNFMKSVMASLKERKQIRTAETYRSTLNSFMRFRDGMDIMLDRIDSDVVEAYEAFLKGNGNTPNTTSYYMRILRAVYNRAVEMDIVEDSRPFKHVYTGVAKTVKRALPLSAIRKIKALDLSGNPDGDYARDMFLMSFYLRGMSFVDMAYLRKSNLRNGVLTYRRRKTGQRLSIAWTKEMQAIVDKYPPNPSEHLLPIITKARCAERSTYLNKARKINRELKTVAMKAGVRCPVSLYWARHSWASIARSKGIPISVISEGMGHDSEATTQIYLASLETSSVDNANRLIMNALE